MKRFLVICVVFFFGCSPAFQMSRAIHTAQEVLEDLEPLAPETEESRLAFSATEEALELGETATNTWQRASRASSPEEGYTQWVQLAIQGFESLFELLEEAGIDIPQEARLALLGIQFVL